MHDARSHRITRRSHLGIPIEQEVHECSVAIAGTRVHHDARGLIDHDDSVIFIDDVECATLLCGGQLGPGCLRNVDGDRLTLLHALFACDNDYTVYGDGAGIDQRRGSTATDVGNERHDTIDAHISKRRRNLFGHAPRKTECVVVRHDERSMVMTCSSTRAPTPQS